MQYSYSFSDSREADRATISAGTPPVTLVRRAGEALAQAVLQAMKKTGMEDVLFVCGGGNNGADGFAAAELVRRAQKDVAVLCLATKFTPECEQVKGEFGGDILGRIPRMRCGLICDCLLGTGLHSAPTGDAAALIGFIRSCGAYVVSADVPSGLGENGVAYEPHVVANETVCMGQLKSALILGDGQDCAGKVTVADIGIPPVGQGVEVWKQYNVSPLFPPKKHNVHKGVFGSACILACDLKYTGAAFLAAGACLKSGAGYTRLYVPEALYPYAIGRLPAAVLRPFEGIDEEIMKSDCIALGMGAGTDGCLPEILCRLLKEYTGTLVLDADALNTISRMGTEILNTKKCRAILTPHAAEFSRLTKKSVHEVELDRVNLAKSFAREHGVTLLLKGCGTVVTDGTRTAILTEGSPCLSKGGSGDVLTGLIAGTAARGIGSFEAACAGSFLLGRAANIVAREQGEYAPDGSDIVSAIGRAQLSLYE